MIELFTKTDTIYEFWDYSENLMIELERLMLILLTS